MIAARLSLTLSLLYFLCLTTRAQPLRPDTVTAILDHPARWVIKFAPLALFDYDNTIQLAGERLLGRPKNRKQHSLQAEFGYGWLGFNRYEQRHTDFDKFEVWRGRFEWRRYTGGYRRYRQPYFATAPIGRYYGIETFFKQLNVVQTTAIGRECADGACAYFERGSYPLFRTVLGAHFKFGRQYVFSFWGAKRLLLDFYMGIGFRHFKPYQFSNSDPTDVVFQTDFTSRLGRRREPGLLPSGTIGLKVGYIL